MTKLSIPLEGLGGTSLPFDAHPLDDLMSQALESTNGIELEFTSASDAIAKRHKIYARRRKVQREGIHSFDKLIIQIKGSTLTMKREPDFKLREL